MEPPPAPIASIPVTGIMRGNSPTSDSVETIGAPFRISDRSVLVPPMSMVRRSGSSSILPRNRAAVTPDAGPESNVWTGKARASRAAMTPPLDLVMKSRDVGRRSRRYASISPR